MIQQKNFKPLVYAVLCLLLIALQFHLYVSHSIKHELKDYTVYAEAGERFSEGIDLYKESYKRRPYIGSGPDIEMYYFYPPYFAAFHAVLNGAGAEAAKLTWALINFAALLAGVLALFKLLQTRFTEIKPELLMLYVLLAVSCFLPVFAGALEGQVNPIIFLCLSFFLLFVHKEEYLTAGLILGLAAAIKISPIVVLGALPFVGNRRILAGVVSMLLLIFLCSFGFGLTTSHYVSFFNSVFFIGAQGAHAQAVFNFSAPVRLAEYSKLLSAAVYVVILVLALWRTKGSSSKLLAYSIWICVMFCASPLVWYHHFIWLLPPLAAYLVFTPKRDAAMPHILKAAAVYFVLMGAYVFHLEAVGLKMPLLQIFTGLMPVAAVMYLIFELKPMEKGGGSVKQQFDKQNNFQ